MSYSMNKNQKTLVRKVAQRMTRALDALGDGHPHPPFRLKTKDLAFILEVALEDSDVKVFRSITKTKDMR